MKTTVVKYYLFILLLAFCCQAPATAKSKLDNPADCINYVKIQGSSNINKFEFVNLSPSILKSSNKGNADKTGQNIKIPVTKFSGANNMMLNDFYKMLNVSEYPYINIEIESRESADFDETTGLTNFNTRISIAGNTHIYNIPCQIIFCEQSGLIVKGDLAVDLSDFNIDPPKKVFGTVKVNDEVFITFAFHYL